MTYLMPPLLVAVGDVDARVSQYTINKSTEVYTEIDSNTYSDYIRGIFASGIRLLIKCKLQDIEFILKL